MYARSTDHVCAVLLVRREDGAALLQHRDDKPGLRRAGIWVFPGGHCEEGEELALCAAREMEEETAYLCSSRLAHLYTFQDDTGDGKPYPLSIFWEFYDGHQKIECLEGQALRFVTPAEARTLRFEPNLQPAWDAVLKFVGQLS
jgi:8-oxo-dGTP pyrophosphatase MutT (NUDIX family)